MNTMPRMPTEEILVDELDPDKWVTVEQTGFRLYQFWEHPETGASIVLFDVPKGSGVPIKHAHASNQFMYCLKGEYEYTDSGLILRPGSFYMNPKDHPHGGGEGKAPTGMPPKTPWGRPAMGYKTRRGRRRSDKFIVRPRGRRR